MEYSISLTRMRSIDSRLDLAYFDIPTDGIYTIQAIVTFAPVETHTINFYQLVIGYMDREGALRDMVGGAAKRSGVLTVNVEEGAFRSGERLYLAFQRTFSLFPQFYTIFSGTLTVTLLE